MCPEPARPALAYYLYDDYDTEEWDEFDLSRLNPEQLRRVYDACKLRFYEVVEVEIE